MKLKIAVAVSCILIFIIILSIISIYAITTDGVEHINIDSQGQIVFLDEKPECFAKRSDGIHVFIDILNDYN